MCQDTAGRTGQGPALADLEVTFPNLGQWVVSPDALESVAVLESRV
jgi:hypothetical protein